MKYITVQLGDKQIRAKEEEANLGVSISHGEIRVRFSWGKNECP